MRGRGRGRKYQAVEEHWSFRIFSKAQLLRAHSRHHPMIIISLFEKKKEEVKRRETKRKKQKEGEERDKTRLAMKEKE